MRALLDSSVLVAAYISRAGACASLLEDILNDHVWVTSNFILDELARKLKGKFSYSDQEVAEIRESIVAAAEVATPEEIPADVCRDPNDLPVLGTAVAGRAEIIITVDKDLLTLKSYREIPIVKPGEFWKLVDVTGGTQDVTTQGGLRSMTTTKIRKSNPADGARVLEIWRRAVDATHDFLSPKDRRDIDTEVAAFLPNAPLDLAVDETDRAIGFMLLHDGHMDALFIDPDFRGSGIGRALVEEAIRRHPNLSTDVNEQNSQAIGFYERIGFERCGRSALDGQGRPYPLIYLRYAKPR